jgi:hypothetical protein
MGNKIYSIVQDDLNNLDHYLHFVARLSKDFDLDLEFVSPGIIKNPEKATSILGEGIPKIVPFEKSRAIDEIQQRVSSSLTQFNTIKYSISELQSDKDVSSHYKDSLMWTINQTSKDSFLNELMGTMETDLFRQTKMPTLTIPNGCAYSRPQTILLIIRDTPDLDFTHFNKLIDKMDIRVVYAFQEDEQEVSIEKIMDSINVEFKNFIGRVKSISMDYSDNMLDKILDSEKPEWIAFANYDRSLLERIYKVNTNELILSSQLPVLNF